MRGEPLKDRTMTDIIKHLRLAFEIFEAAGRSKLGIHVGEKRGYCAVAALVPVVICPGIADGPAVRFRDEGLEALEGGDTGDAELDTEAAIDAVVGFKRLELIRAGVAQVHLIRAARVVARVIERAH